MPMTLSRRESQIVDLSVEGLTNEAIAAKLGVSIGTVNTYWLRVKAKVGGQGKTDTVARIVQNRAKNALRASNAELNDLVGLAHLKEHGHMEVRAVLELLHVAMDQIHATIWATDAELVTQIVVQGDFPEIHFGAGWEAGRSVYEIFGSIDPDDPAIKAHLRALAGESTELQLKGEFGNLLLRVAPLNDEMGQCLGTIGIVTCAA